MDGITVSTDGISALYAGGGSPAVSLYLPLDDEGGREHAEALLAGLVDQALEKLSQERDRREYVGIASRLEHLAGHPDQALGGGAARGLAVLADNDSTRVVQLGYHVEPRAVVGEGFYLAPLVRHFQYGSHYFLLGLSADRFAFIRGDAVSLRRVDPPADVLDEFSEEFPLVYDGHEGALDYSSLENHLPPYHGWKSRNDVKKEEAEKFFRHVNKAVTEHLAKGTGLPVILVSLPEHQAAFRRISTVPHLLDEGILKDVGGLEAPELLGDALAVIGRARAAHAAELLEAYGDAAAHGKATSDLAAIGMALAERRVRALFLAEGAYVPGGFDEATGEVSLFEREPHGRFQGPELADGFARAAFAQDAEVLELPADQVPADTGIAALFRY